MRWYLIHCKPSGDRRALEHLERQGFECYLPTIDVEKLRHGRKLEVHEPLFPRYLFIRLNDTDHNWSPIRSTRGVSQLVCFDGRPVPVADEIIEEVRTRLANRSLKKPYLRPGERVEINDGAFVSVEAIFLAADGDERVVVLLSMMQKAQAMVFPLRAVRRLAR